MKKHVLATCKTIGLIQAYKLANKNKLNILCYHGIAKHDEHLWQPSLFINQNTFKNRMLFIKKHYNVLPLDEAITQLKNRTLPSHSVAITFDDGFDNFYTHAWPVLRSLNLPATLYLTSYYAEKQSPIFRLALSYVFWKKRGTQINIKNLQLAPGHSLQGTVPLNNPQPFFWPLVEFAERHLSDRDRTALLIDIAKKLGINFQEINTQRLFHLINREQLKNMMSQGLDVQLHSHRHVTPDNAASLHKEIQENLCYINCGKQLNHYCYPSGLYNESHPEMLKNLGMLSATTCDRGLNSHRDNPFKLKRLMDGTQLSILDFEAELSGLAYTLSKWGKCLPYRKI